MKDEKRPDNDEFDVEALAGKLYKLCVKVIRKLLLPFTLLISDWKRLAIALFIGIGVATVLYFTITPVYKTSFTIKPANKKDLFFFSVSHNLEQAVRSQEINAVMDLLKCNEEIANNFTDISLNTQWVNPAKKDSLNSVIIEISVKDPKYIDTIQRLYMNYLEKSTYYSRIRQAREMSVNLTLNKLHADMKNIDSLQKMALTDAKPRDGGGFVFGEPLNPVKLYEDALTLYKQEISYTTQLKYLDNFEVVSDCLHVSRPAWPNILKLLVICCGCSLLLMALISWGQLKS